MMSERLHSYLLEGRALGTLIWATFWIRGDPDISLDHMSWVTSHLYFVFFSILLCASNETHVTHYRFVRNNVGVWVGLVNKNVESKTAKGRTQLVFE